MKDIRQYQKETNRSMIDTDLMQKYLQIKDYTTFAKVVVKLVDDGILSPVKRSKGNSKKPPLYNRYRIMPEEKDYSGLVEEMNYKINYELNMGYYKERPERYVEDRDEIRALSQFLNTKKEKLKIQISTKERSFQIWGREKFLEKEGGISLLNRLRFSMHKLNIYSTTEPLAYYSQHKSSPQNILIIENKDTYYTFRKYLLEGNTTFFTTTIGTVIYGSGKTIWNSFSDFALGVEDYLLDTRNELYYFGDLDYEGLFIFQQLKDNFKGKVEIKPFMDGYKYMINKMEVENMKLSKTKDGQNKNHYTQFLDYFDETYKKKIIDLLESNLYIPQEIINYGDLVREGTNGV
ncbi:Wadjet anti-phage system protein JetD domain-containing protein [Alkaliphilus transvaalensis]|uniref:Wadjet anti-phage system protein JetD domain-containing protein n=1 Tax=Alkaliphilus transvaalensis TaxID=114628 RepID=UPI00047E1A68|nr:Wadjet anti-phage system protein JetD domain-containing protein [Alkaliphilus transvaalensis]